MTNIELQKLLNETVGGDVIIPSGEFEGPFAVNKPCRIIGRDVTLWRNKGPVLSVNAPNVILEELRVEITNNNLNAADSVAVSSARGDTKFNDVEIIGRLSGIKDEEKAWGIPKFINLGRLPAERACSFELVLTVPVRTEIMSTVHDITLTPSVLEAGTTSVTMTVSPVRSGSYIYGELLFRSAVTRRVYVSGSADENVTAFEDGSTLYKADPEALAEEERDAAESAAESFVEEVIFPEMSEPLPEKNEMYTAENKDDPADLNSLFILERGMHIPITCATAEIELIYDNKDFPMEIDAFAFMADKHLTVTKNDRFVFFGNDHSNCGGVRYLNAPDKKVLYVNFNILPLDIAEIDIAYSIYENPTGLNFSHLKNPAVSVRLSDGRNLIYPLVKPLDQNTLVGLEICYTNSRWELTPLGMVYPMGLNSLCSNYGLKIR
ncbi:MAG: TerD family protein [Oscillospiraceae bacterium]|nr:TerD family protein [Oscillospiraceae bacterium]